MKVYFAADHAGFELKNELLNFVRGDLALEVEDCGALAFDPDDDYPEIISIAADALGHDAKKGLDNRAILIGKSGQGEAMVANRYSGVRCAVYYGGSTELLKLSRQHNNANALSLGADFISLDEAKNALKEWFFVPFSGEDRHVRRIQQFT